MPVIDEQLTVKKEDSNEHDRYASLLFVTEATLVMKRIRKRRKMLLQQVLLAVKQL